MALDYFAEYEVDIAIIETGLGGRLDSTNVITPLLSVITNISYDHTEILGDTLAKIAYEKAGIIKPNVPVIIGDAVPETKPVFEIKAAEVHSPIFFAQDEYEILSTTYDVKYLEINVLNKKLKEKDVYRLDLNGFYQQKKSANELLLL